MAKDTVKTEAKLEEKKPEPKCNCCLDICEHTQKNYECPSCGESVCYSCCLKAQSNHIKGNR